VTNQAGAGPIGLGGGSAAVAPPASESPLAEQVAASSRLGTRPAKVTRPTTGTGSEGLRQACFKHQPPPTERRDGRKPR
jgi:hypothetical protein